MIKKIQAPASKSYLQRALAVSALAGGNTVLTNVSWCADSLSAKKIINKLGAITTEQNNTLEIQSSPLKFGDKNFFAGESGLSLRMFSPILALSDEEISFTGEGTLLKRPVKLIEEALSQLGVKVISNSGFLPLKIKGKIKAGKITIDGSLSSQLLSGLLITLPLLDADSEILVHNLKSRPYIDMTLAIIKDFGVNIENIDYKKFTIKGKQKYKARTYNIEGDWSGASFLLVYGAVKNAIEVNNLNPHSLQADKAILDVLQKAGANVHIKTNSIIITPGKLKAFEFDASHCPDLFPPLVALATQCEGISKIKGVFRLLHKESNRAMVIKQELSKLGIEIEINKDIMFIKQSQLKSGVINSHNDHRIAMLGGILNLFSKEKISVENKQAVNKSYPGFFDVI